MSAPPRAFPPPPMAGAQSFQGSAEAASSTYRGAQGLDPEFIAELEAQFGFDKPVHERFFKMIWDYARFDFGESYYRDVAVVDLIKEKLPVSITLGLWTTLLTYLISIPLGIAKARRDGTAFDVWTSGVIIVGYAIPGFLFAVMLIVLFAGGSYFDWFPLRGLTSDNFDEPEPWRANPRLSLAYFPAGAGALHIRFCDHLAFDQKRVSGRDTQTICRDRARQRAECRNPRALRPCVPQCHADCHCRISRRIYRRVFYRLLAD